MTVMIKDPKKCVSVIGNTLCGMGVYCKACLLVDGDDCELYDPVEEEQE